MALAASSSVQPPMPGRPCAIAFAKVMLPVMACEMLAMSPGFSAGAAAG